MSAFRLVRAAAPVALLVLGACAAEPAAERPVAQATTPAPVLTPAPAAAQPGAPDDAAVLSGGFPQGAWRPVSAGRAGAEIATPLTFTFGDGDVSGATPCNLLRGGYTAREVTFSVTFAMTRRACVSDGDRGDEQALIEGLADAHAWALVDGALVLRDEAGAPSLRFERPL